MKTKEILLRGRVNTLTPKYSGEQSEEFWGAVNSLPDSLKEIAYPLGCDLQELESTVLDMLEGVVLKRREVKNE